MPVKVLLRDSVPTVGPLDRVSDTEDAEEAPELSWDAGPEVLKADSEPPVTEADKSPDETPVGDSIEPLEVSLAEPELPSVKESEAEGWEEETSELCWEGESEVLEAPESELPGEDVD